MKKLCMILLIAGGCFAATTALAQGAGAGNKKKKDPKKHCVTTVNTQCDRGTGSVGSGGHQRQGD